MEQRRRRARTPNTDVPADGGQPDLPNGGDASWLKRGSAIVQTAEQEAVKQKEKSEMRKAGLGFVMRLWLKKGEEREVIVLDKSLQDVVALYEHNLKDSQGRWGNHESCVKEFANCPLCEKDKESYYVMFLTVLDLAGYDKKDPKTGKVTEHVEQVKRLLPVKSTQIPKWRQMEQAAINEAGTMRGMYVVLGREMGDQSVSTGEPLILDNGKVFEMLSEQTLVADYGHDAMIGRDGKSVIKEANADLKPFDYVRLFPKPDPDDLAKRYGFKAGAGSARETVDAWGAEQEAETAQGRRRRPAAGQTPPAPAPDVGTRTRTRRAPATAAATAEKEPFAGEEESELPY